MNYLFSKFIHAYIPLLLRIILRVNIHYLEMIFDWVKWLYLAAVSPDMNPIQHILDYLGTRVHSRSDNHNPSGLENAVIQVWNVIPQRIQTLL